MKKSILILAVLIPVFCFSQNENSRFFVETGVTMFGGGDYMPFVGKTGVSFWQSKTFVEYDGKVELVNPDGYHATTFSIAPRIGYFLSKKTSAGIDFQYFRSFNFYKGNYDYKENYRNILSGIFLRYYIFDKKSSPFLELASGTGISKNIQKSMSAGGLHFDKIRYFNLPYISGTIGYSFSLNPRFNLGIAATVQKTFEKYKKGNISTDIDKFTMLETGMIASISYNFNLKKKEHLK